MAQSLLSKYVWIIDTIYKADRISFKELNSRWLDSEISEGVEIPKRTFDNWRYAIQDMFGLFIENEGKGKYRYYIMNKEDISKNGLRSWIYNTFCVSNALAESQSIKDRILLEYVPSGQEYLQEIIEAMKSNQILNITYHSYWKDEENNFDVEPFCVKLFRQRWYLVARSTYTYYHEQGPRIYCLDRITYLHKKEETESNEEYSIFTYYLRPTFDFQQELLWNGEDLEVLAPTWLRKELAGKIKRMWNKYNISE